MLQAGIVGLPNVGKSTLFNAVTRTRKAQAANYPFCTIDPNVGMVTVPDPRLQVLSNISGSEKIIPTLIEFVDIAGLVKEPRKEPDWATNSWRTSVKWMPSSRWCAALTMTTSSMNWVPWILCATLKSSTPELILADIATMDKRLSSRERKARSGDKEAKAEVALITKLLPHLNEGLPAITFEEKLDDDERKLLRSFQLLSDKKSIFACNVNEDELAAAINDPDSHPYVSQVRKYVAEHHNAEAIVISARIEEELIDVSEEEAAEFLESLGVQDSGVSDLIRAVYHLLGLRTYLTTGVKETRAWTIPDGAKAPQAAGVIHTDFERGFIAAEVVHYDDLVTCGSKAGAREHGKLRIEGKEYIVKDGDVIEFRFNV